MTAALVSRSRSCYDGPRMRAGIWIGPWAAALLLLAPSSGEAAIGRTAGELTASDVPLVDVDSLPRFLDTSERGAFSAERHLAEPACDARTGGTQTIDRTLRERRRIERDLAKRQLAEIQDERETLATLTEEPRLHEPQGFTVRIWPLESGPARGPPLS